MDPHDILRDEPLAALPLAEDGGAKVTTALRWQHHCAAKWLIAAVREETIRAIVCETHEDFLVLHENGEVTAVSAKHRDIGEAAWTPNSLCRKGGLDHLFSFWQRAEGRPTCCVMTSGKLSTGADGAGQLASDCSRGNSDKLRTWIPTMSAHLGGDADALSRFLVGLRVLHALPTRDYVEAVHARQYMMPALSHLKLDPARHIDAYRALVGLVAEHSGDRPPDGNEDLARLARPGSDWDADLRMGRLAQRVITRQDALAQILDATVSSLPPLREADDPPPPTRMIRKLEAGGLGPTTQRSAKRLRAGWYRLESQLRGVSALNDELEDLRMRAQSIAGDSQEQVGPREPYGSEMLADIQARLTVGSLPRRYPFLLEEALLRGLIFQLTDECEVWWSSERRNEELTALQDHVSEGEAGTDA